MISQANFAFEPASIEEFRLNFIHVHCKMCCFHVRQAMHRRIQRMGLANLYTSREQEGRAFQALIRKIGALQFAPPNHVNRSVHLMQQLINESELELVIRLSLLDILEYYVTTWVRNSIGSEFFSLFYVPVHRTINHAESYHGRQRWFYQPHQLLGRWLVNFQEVNHAEEESAVSIQEGRQPPSQPLAVTAEIDASIAREKADIMAFLDSDYEDEQFTETLSRYYGRIGHLIGFNVPPRLEIEEQIEEAAAMEEAEASLNESGIYVVPNDENLDPFGPGRSWPGTQLAWDAVGGTQLAGRSWQDAVGPFRSGPLVTNMTSISKPELEQKPKIHFSQKIHLYCPKTIQMLE
ncbi:hypothetical protein niasHT_033257 [Heterodera trifolii]|uniref:Transposase n=1 Tax=Heterodera trifolii TaxID=157864 RepID=A0ABD2ITS6_9BILA